MSSIAERFYLITKRHKLLAKATIRLYAIMRRPKWMPRFWARGEREWSTRMFEEQIRDIREEMGEL